MWATAQPGRRMLTEQEILMLRGGERGVGEELIMWLSTRLTCKGDAEGWSLSSLWRKRRDHRGATGDKGTGRKQRA